MHRMDFDSGWHWDSHTPNTEWRPWPVAAFPSLSAQLRVVKGIINYYPTDSVAGSGVLMETGVWRIETDIRCVRCACFATYLSVTRRLNYAPFLMST